MSTQAERVARGVEYMDRVAGERWPAMIDFESLDMVDPESCVLGQTVGYNSHSNEIYETSNYQESAGDYGFNTSGPNERYDTLRKRWVTVIGKLRKERGLDDKS